MSGAGSGGGGRFDISVNPATPPEREVIDAAPEDTRRRDAAAASTYDPEFAHDGKTEEQLIKERDDQARLLADVAIVTGIVLAVEATERDDAVGEEEVDVELDGENGADADGASD